MVRNDAYRMFGGRDSVQYFDEYWELSRGSNTFGPDKVVLGNAYRQDSPTAPYEPTNYVPIATTLQAFSDLRGSGINIRGAFVWTIQSDGDGSYAWSSGVGADILANP